MVLKKRYIFLCLFLFIFLFVNDNRPEKIILEIPSLNKTQMILKEKEGKKLKNGTYFYFNKKIFYTTTKIQLEQIKNYEDFILKKDNETYLYHIIKTNTDFFKIGNNNESKLMIYQDNLQYVFIAKYTGKLEKNT